VHEWGHALQMRREGIPTTPILFVPFLGAVIGMKEAPRNAWVEAKVGLAGPVVGTLGAAAVLALGVGIDSDLLRAAGYTGFLLNLFNLLPIVPLDGGRAAAALHPAVWVVGLAGLGALLFVSPNPILILILIVGALEAWRRWRSRKAGEDLDYYHVEPLQRVAVGVTFFAIAVACVLGMSVSQVDV
jgi:Zn-dependent protease